MNISLIAVGTRMAGWVREGVDDYGRRLGSEARLRIVEIPLARRSKSGNIDQVMQKEGRSLIDKIPDGDYVVAMEVNGRSLSTTELAGRLEALRYDKRNLSLLVGGPDGLAAECRQRADDCWSLSALTLPHPLVRIVLVEQLYRAFSLLRGHPYHRE